MKALCKISAVFSVSHLNLLPLAFFIFNLFSPSLQVPVAKKKKQMLKRKERKNCEAWEEKQKQNLTLKNSCFWQYFKINIQNAFEKCFFPALKQPSIILSCPSIPCILSACPGNFVLEESTETNPNRSLSLQENPILLYRREFTAKQNIKNGQWRLTLRLPPWSSMWALIFLGKSLRLGCTEQLAPGVNTV